MRPTSGALSALILLFGCGTPAAPIATTAAASADFTNAENQLVCPVMGDVVATKEQAMGHAEYEGKTYWFCCDSCQHAFAADPERYAEGRHIAHLKAEHGGQFGACNHPL